MKDIKFRAWQDGEMYSSPLSSNYGLARFMGFLYEDAPLMQYTGLKDKNGKEIYFDDILRFSDKWEWYRGEYGIKMMFADKKRKEELQAKYDAEPYEERVVESIEDYEWLLSSEIQQYWEVIGNKWENPELLEETK